VRWKSILVIGAGSVKLSVTNHDSSGIEYLALVRVDDLAAAGWPLGDALSEKVVGTGGSCSFRRS
jgi:hypothetical protein